MADLEHVKGVFTSNVTLSGTGQARRLSATVAALVAGHEAEAERYAAMLGIAGSLIGDRGEGVR